MRKVLLALLAMMMVLLVGCGKKEICTVDGCTQEVYKDGLCADHYVEEAMATPAPTTTPEPTIVDGLKDGYQEYIDAAIECVRSSLKNPNSLVIYNMYLEDADKTRDYISITIYVDIGAENSYGGIVRDFMVYGIGTASGKLEGGLQNAASKSTKQSLHKSIVEITSGQRSEEEAAKIEEGYYKRHGEYYLVVPQEWYANYAANG